MREAWINHPYFYHELFCHRPKRIDDRGLLNETDDVANDHSVKMLSHPKQSIASRHSASEMGKASSAGYAK
jgi:hypothetical protein